MRWKSLLTFGLAWILRHEVMSDSNVLSMTTYFYNILVKEGGLDGMMQWFQKMDIFTKRFIFFQSMSHCIGHYASSLTLMHE